MKYTNIANTLGWPADHTVEEGGLFLQPEEVSALDAVLADAGTNAQPAADLVQANERIGQLEQQVNEGATREQEQQARISELEAENVRLGSESSGTGTVITTSEDTSVEKGKTPSYLDDSAPENQWLDRQLARNRKKQ